LTETPLGQVGVAAIIVILILRELMPLLRKRNGNGASGERPVEYWEQVFRRIVSEEVEKSERRIAAKLDDAQRDVRAISDRLYSLMNPR
jgi:hypothetical protein